MDKAKIKKKLRLMSELYHFVFEVKKTQLRRKFPNLSEVELRKLTIQAMRKGTKS